MTNRATEYIRVSKAEWERLRAVERELWIAVRMLEDMGGRVIKNVILRLREALTKKDDDDR